MGVWSVATAGDGVSTLRKYRVKKLIRPIKRAVSYRPEADVGMSFEACKNFPYFISL